jgi:hypothetical protein
METAMLRRLFGRQEAPVTPVTERRAPTHLNNVIAGSGFAQHVVGYVDDFGGVYDLDLRALGDVDNLAHHDEHVVRTSARQVVGFVGSKAEPINGGSWYEVYNAAHTLVGLVDNASEIDTPSGQQLGTITYNEGNGGTGWRRAGAALLLLLLQ